MGRSISSAYHVCLQPGTDARRDRAAPSRASSSSVPVLAGDYCELSMEGRLGHVWLVVYVVSCLLFSILSKLGTGW